MKFNFFTDPVFWVATILLLLVGAGGLYYQHGVNRDRAIEGNSRYIDGALQNVYLNVSPEDPIAVKIFGPYPSGISSKSKAVAKWVATPLNALNYLIVTDRISASDYAKAVAVLENSAYIIISFQDDKAPVYIPNELAASLNTSDAETIALKAKILGGKNP